MIGVNPLANRSFAAASDNDIQDRPVYWPVISGVEI